MRTNFTGPQSSSSAAATTSAYMPMSALPFLQLSLESGYSNSNPPQQQQQTNATNVPTGSSAVPPSFLSSSRAMSTAPKPTGNVLGSVTTAYMSSMPRAGSTAAQAAFPAQQQQQTSSNNTTTAASVSAVIAQLMGSVPRASSIAAPAGGGGAAPSNGGSLMFQNATSKPSSGIPGYQQMPMVTAASAMEAQSGMTMAASALPHTNSAAHTHSFLSGFASHTQNAAAGGSYAMGGSNLDSVRAEHAKLLQQQAQIDAEERALEEESHALYARLSQLSAASAELEQTDAAIRAEWDAVHADERRLESEPIPDLTPAIEEAEGRIAIAQAKFQQASERLSALESQLPLAQQIEQRKAQQAKEVESLQSTLQALEVRRRMAIALLEQHTDVENCRHRDLSRALSMLDFEDNVVRQQAVARSYVPKQDDAVSSRQPSQALATRAMQQPSTAAQAPPLSAATAPQSAAPSRAVSLAPVSTNALPSALRAKSVSFAPACTNVPPPLTPEDPTPSANKTTTVSMGGADANASQSRQCSVKSAGGPEDDMLAGIVASRAASTAPAKTASHASGQPAKQLAGFTDYAEMFGGLDNGVSLVLDSVGGSALVGGRGNSVSNAFDTKRRRKESMPAPVAGLDFGAEHSVALDIY